MFIKFLTIDSESAIEPGVTDPDQAILALFPASLGTGDLKPLEVVLDRPGENMKFDATSLIGTGGDMIVSMAYSEAISQFLINIYKPTNGGWGLAQVLEGPETPVNFGISISLYDHDRYLVVRQLSTPARLHFYEKDVAGLYQHQSTLNVGENDQEDYGFQGTAFAFNDACDVAVSLYPYFEGMGYSVQAYTWHRMGTSWYGPIMSELSSISESNPISDCTMALSGDGGSLFVIPSVVGQGPKELHRYTLSDGYAYHNITSGGASSADTLHKLYSDYQGNHLILTRSQNNMAVENLYVTHFNNTNTTFEQIHVPEELGIIEGSTVGLGSAMSGDGKTLVISGSISDNGVDMIGAIHHFKFVNGTYQYTNTFIEPDVPEVMGEYFGMMLSVSYGGEYVLVANPGWEHDGTYRQLMMKIAL